MEKHIKKAIDTTKGYWEKIPKKKKIYIGAIAGGVLLFAVIAAVVLNMSGGKYTVLYPGIDSQESMQVYSTLQDMSVPAQLNSKGEVMVEKGKVDELLIELSALGYPKTAPSYNIFSDSSGFTATEFEKKQYLLFQLQNRLQDTLNQIDGVKSSVVTLDVPQESNYVWEEEGESAESSGSVLITMERNKKLSPKKVSAIKNLVASSVPRMEAASVTVVDAETSLEMKASDETGDTEIDQQRLGFETEVENRMIEKIINVFSARYGKDGVRVSATVVIDYDKMITEQMEYIPQEDGDGITSHLEDNYTLNDGANAGGVVGEENNTDIPIYVDSNNDGENDLAQYSRSIDYIVSYIKRQIEKDKAQLKEASIAIVVDDPALTNQKRMELIDTASKAVNVAPENISVNNFEFLTDEEDGTGKDKSFVGSKLFYGLIAGFVLILIAAVVITIILLKRKKKLEEEEAVEAAMQEELLVNAQKEADERKRQLKEAAEASNTKENAIMNEIKDFAKNNPEITASLIRAWLKGED